VVRAHVAQDWAIHMRVVHLSTSLQGGAGIAARRLHSALLTAGIDSWLLAISGSNESLLQEDESSQVVVVERSPRARLASAASMKANQFVSNGTGVLFTPFSTHVGLAELIAKLRPNIIHGHNYFNFFDPFHLSALAPKSRIVFTLHDERLFTAGCHYSLDCHGFTESCSPCRQARPAMRSIIRLREKQMSLVEDALIIGPSEWIISQAAKSAVLREHEKELIRNAVPTNLFSPPTANDDVSNVPRHPLRVLWHAGKDDTTILRAISSLVSQSSLPGGGLQVKHTGDSPQASALSQSVGTTSAQTRMAQLLQQTDVYLHSSVSDNSPNSIAEALCSGVPVFASDTGGSMELISGTGGGGGFAHGKHEQLEALLMGALESQMWLGQMKRSALRCRSLVDPSTVAKQHIEVYEKRL
jgi:glycosyltransferase involved in cell wall biosynthesis